MADRYDTCVQTIATPIPGGNPTHCCIHIEARISNPSPLGAREGLSTDTTVTLPFPHHPQGSLLAALVRLHALLEAEIQAIRSNANP